MHSDGASPTTSSSPTSPIPIRNHESYWLETVVMQVQDCLFQVPKIYFANNAEFFAPAFAAGNKAPLKLKGISIAEFNSLLKLFYPLSLEGPQLSVEEWEHVLKLSTKWRMIEVRRISIKHLALILGPIDRVPLARSYGVSEWLLSAYVELAEQKKGVSFAVGTALGMEAAMNLCRVREMLLRIPRNDTQKPGYSTPIIKEVFEEELSNVLAASNGCQRP